jgi:hypothetical protein
MPATQRNMEDGAGRTGAAEAGTAEIEGRGGDGLVEAGSAASGSAGRAADVAATSESDAVRDLRDRVLNKKVRVETDDDRHWEGWFVSLDASGGILLRSGTLVRYGGDAEDIAPPEPSLGYVLVPGSHVRRVTLIATA